MDELKQWIKTKVAQIESARDNDHNDYNKAFDAGAMFAMLQIINKIETPEDPMQEFFEAYKRKEEGEV